MIMANSNLLTSKLLCCSLKYNEFHDPVLVHTFKMLLNRKDYQFKTKYYYENEDIQENTRMIELLPIYPSVLFLVDLHNETLSKS